MDNPEMFRSAVGPVREAVSSCLSSLIIVFNSSSQFVNLIARNISVLCNMTDAVHLSAENSMKSLLMKQAKNFFSTWFLISWILIHKWSRLSKFFSVVVPTAGWIINSEVPFFGSLLFLEIWWILWFNNEMLWWYSWRGFFL